MAIVLGAIALNRYLVARSQTLLAQTETANRLTQEAIADAKGQARATQENVAQREARLSFARELASKSVQVLERDPALGLLLAIAAVNATLVQDGFPTSEAEVALYNALTSSPYRGMYQISSPPFMATFVGNSMDVLTIDYTGVNQWIDSY